MTSAATQTMSTTKDSNNPEPPPLTYTIVSSDTDRREALTLVTDSIAQQRQTASFAVISHPLCVAGLAAACAYAWRRHAGQDLGTALTVASGLAIAFLAAVRMLTSRYLQLAEAFRWREWLRAPIDGGDAEAVAGEQPTDDDLVLAARFGDELIATLVLRVPRPSSSKNTNRKKAATAKTKASKGNGEIEPSHVNDTGIIRAWTTKIKYRNKGVGADMLRFAIATTRSACGPHAVPVFAPDHANSALPLPRIFNRVFHARDERARKALARAVRDSDAGAGSFEAL